eukprot:5533655-Pleurochrysis_carterae.AAC.1
MQSANHNAVSENKEHQVVVGDLFQIRGTNNEFNTSGALDKVMVSASRPRVHDAQEQKVHDVETKIDVCPTKETTTTTTGPTLLSE